ncbi:hypothetical protein WP50_22615 [Lactiplantibacillus plantarum]|nr:hypothetical protein WP50_22615 [Lactiplantibacillus plantarum]
MQLAITVANERYLATDQPLTNQAIQFLQQVVLQPLVADGQFDQATFDRQKKNLEAAIMSVADLDNHEDFLQLLTTSKGTATKFNYFHINRSLILSIMKRIADKSRLGNVNCNSREFNLVIEIIILATII